MEKDQLLLECYRIYTDSKERFIDRSFATNKFYLVIEVILLTITATLMTAYNNTLIILLLSALGFFIGFLWWFNQDAYEQLIKTKYKDVLEVIEKDLPVAPTTMEYQASQKDAKERKAFVFQSAYKVLAFLVILAFLSFFVLNIMPILGIGMSEIG